MTQLQEASTLQATLAKPYKIKALPWDAPRDAAKRKALETVVASFDTVGEARAFLQAHAADPAYKKRALFLAYPPYVVN